MTTLEKGSLNKFGEKVIGHTFAYSQWWNVVEVPATKLREKLIGHQLEYVYKTASKRINVHTIVNVGRLEYSPYLMLEVEPSELQIKEHQEAREQIKKEMGIELNPHPINIFVPLTDNKQIYKYLLMDQNHDLMKCDWETIGEKIYQ